MPSVYFATNRAVTNSADPAGGYPATMVPPDSPALITYGIATVAGVDVAADNAGSVSSIADIFQGGFSAASLAAIAGAPNDLLVFIHGFDNTFADAITRAAFNREFLAASGQPRTDTTVIAFSWPSKGQLVGFPVPQGDYLFDQHMARTSGPALTAFLARLQQTLAAARAAGRRVTLLAHSMGNLALQATVENWFLNQKPAGTLFDLAVLAAGDCDYDTFLQPNLARLSGLVQLAGRVSTYFSHADGVLILSQGVNLGAQRLGQDGPLHRTDPALYDPAKYSAVDCTADQDYTPFDFQSSHQYYRRSPKVRALIAADMAGGAAV